MTSLVFFEIFKTLYFVHIFVSAYKHTNACQNLRFVLYYVLIDNNTFVLCYTHIIIKLQCYAIFG